MKKRSRVKPEGRRRWPRLVLILMGILVLPLALWMYLESRIVRLVASDVPVKDLPDAFDGVRVLFVSDLHMCSYASPDATLAVMRDLFETQPDLLIMGGDYTHTGLFGGREAELRRREAFFLGMAAFDAPMGKFAVAGNHDQSLDTACSVRLEDAAAAGGVTVLRNAVARIEKAGASIALAGLDDFRLGRPAVKALAGAVSAEECAVVVSHNPDVFPRIMTERAAGGGDWADLVLCGHMHGGQITLFGIRPLWAPSIYGARYLSGWFREANTRMLVSNGVGSVAIPFRLCAPAQAHLLTLRKG